MDDSVVKISDFPSVQMEEDSQAFVYNFTNYFEDPEGANVTILNASSSTGLNLTWTEYNVAIVPFINWHGNTTIEVYVWDGTSAPIEAIIDVEVTPVPDAPRINMTRIIVTEDTPLEVPLSELGWDEDGDELMFEVSGSHNHVDVMVLTNVLRIVPSDDWTGLADGWYLTAISEDGNVTAPIEFEVLGVNEPIPVSYTHLTLPTNREV